MEAFALLAQSDSGDSFLGWVIGIIIILLIISAFVNSLTKSVQSAKGRRKCAFCGARLKSAARQFGYADHCAKCGRVQPWAAAAPAAAAQATRPAEPPLRLTCGSCEVIVAVTPDGPQGVVNFTCPSCGNPNTYQRP
ncbi:MAG: hypothetical protein WD276_06960 [Actinomycetota bacterium]